MHNDEKYPIGEADPGASEVEGHASHRANDQRANTEAEEGDEPDVEGHIHPILAQQVARERHKDFLAEAQRDQRSMQAQPNERDGGIMDKIRRRKEQ